MTILYLSGGIIYFLPFLDEVYYIQFQNALDLTKTKLESLENVLGISFSRKPTFIFRKDYLT